MLKRISNSKGHNLPITQASDYSSRDRFETIVIPSTTQANFGGYFVIDLKEQGVELKQLTLQYNLSAISVMTSGMFSPAQFFASKIEIWQGGVCQLNIYPEEQFLQSQIFERDEDRNLINCAAGIYSSTTQRIAMAANANSYYHTLRDYVKCAGSTFILSESHNIQLRIWLNPLANITSGTGTATATITNVNLLAKIRRLDENEKNYQMKALMKTPFSFKYNEVKTQTNQVASGASNIVFTLPNLVGNISLVAFIVRPTSGLTGNAQFSFTQVASFEYLSSGGTNITGGNVITSSQALLLYGNDVCLSSYLSENAQGLVNNGANVYLYSFSADAVNDVLTGVDAGVYKFTGAEQLRINFVSALGSASQVDIYAFNSKVLVYTKNGVKSMNA